MKNITLEYGDHAEIESEVYLFVYIGIAIILFIILVCKLQGLLTLQENLIRITQRFNEQDCNELIFIHSVLKENISDMANYNWLHFDRFYERMYQSGSLRMEHPSKKKLDGFYSQRIVN